MERREFVVRGRLIKAHPCEQCGHPIRRESIVRGLRADVKFCSDACKQKAYRERKKLLAPYGGDARAALEALVAKGFPSGNVTDSETTIRNAGGTE